MPRAGGQEGKNWTEERKDLLQAMAKTHCAAEIAEALGPNFNKNMVIGKCRRLGVELEVWHSRPEAPVRLAGWKHEWRPYRPRKRKQNLATEAAQTPAVVRPVVFKRWKPGGLLVRAGWFGSW